MEDRRFSDPTSTNFCRKLVQEIVFASENPKSEGRNSKQIQSLSITCSGIQKANVLNRFEFLF